MLLEWYLCCALQLFVFHFFSNRCLHILQKLFLLWRINLGGAYSTFFIFPSGFRLEFSSYSQFPPVFSPPQFTTLTSTSSSSSYFYMALHVSYFNVSSFLPTCSLSQDSPLWHVQDCSSMHKARAFFYKNLIHDQFLHNWNKWGVYIPLHYILSHNHTNYRTFLVSTSLKKCHNHHPFVLPILEIHHKYYLASDWVIDS
jgi:hypothetical protein